MLATNTVQTQSYFKNLAKILLQKCCQNLEIETIFWQDLSSYQNEKNVTGEPQFLLSFTTLVKYHGAYKKR